MHARPAISGDAEAIARIYNQGIEERVATFETSLRSADDIRSWFGGVHPSSSWRTPAKYCLSPPPQTYRPRECYRGVAEFSVYTDRGARGRSAGGLAMKALIAAAERAGFWKLVSRVFVENMPSRKLLRSAGFREVGVYEKHARLDGAWRDVVIVERLIPSNL